MLVLDKSGSMWYYHSQLKDFARSVLHQFKIGPDSTAMALVEFSSNSRVLRVGGTSGLSYDAAALEQEISEMDAPRGMTNIEAGLEKGLEVMLGTNSRPNVRHRIMILLTDGEQTVGGGTPAAIEKAKQIKAEGDLTLISVGFGGVKETTVQALASAPASENAFKGNDIQAIMEHFSNLCSVIDSPKPPPSPGPPALPPSPSDPRETPPSAPSPPFAPPSICENTCAYASDGTCDDGGAGSEYDLCTVRPRPVLTPDTASPAHALLSCPAVWDGLRRLRAEGACLPTATASPGIGPNLPLGLPQPRGLLGPALLQCDVG